MGRRRDRHSARLRHGRLVGTGQHRRQAELDRPELPRHWWPGRRRDLPRQPALRSRRHLRDPSLDRSFATVGLVEVHVPGSDASSVKRTTRVRTTTRAVTGVVKTCTIGW